MRIPAPLAEDIYIRQFRIIILNRNCFIRLNGNGVAGRRLGRVGVARLEIQKDHFAGFIMVGAVEDEHRAVDFPDASLRTQQMGLARAGECAADVGVEIGTQPIRQPVPLRLEFAREAGRLCQGAHCEDFRVMAVSRRTHGSVAT